MLNDRRSSHKRRLLNNRKGSYRRKVLTEKLFDRECSSTKPPISTKPPTEKTRFNDHSYSETRGNGASRKNPVAVVQEHGESRYRYNQGHFQSVTDAHRLLLI